MSMTAQMAPLEYQLEARKNIDSLEAEIRRMVDSGEHDAPLHDGATPEGQDECNHFFGDGVYARALMIPAQTTVVGKIHRLRRICMILQGECIFMDEHRREHVTAPWIGEFAAGCKTAVYAVTDTYWCAVVGTELTDPQEIIETLSAPTRELYLEHLEVMT